MRNKAIMMIMSRRMALLSVVVLAGMLLQVGQAFADYDVTITNSPSANGAWTGNIWNPSAAGSNVSVSDIQTKLAGGDVTITTSAGTGNGDIIISSPLTWSANTLTLTAGRDVQINAVMTASNTSSLTMNTAQTAAGGTVRTGFAPGGGFSGRVDFDRAGTGFLTINGSGYTVITSLGAQGSTTGTDLQGIGADFTTLSGKYALGANIDASDTAGWNSGAGFAPLGSSYPAFYGVFDGLGHTISGLYIRIVTSYSNCAGLFGCTDQDTITPAALRNVGLVNVSVYNSMSGYGQNNTGGLVGYNSSGSIANSYSTGIVTGSSSDSKNYTGGLVGYNDWGSIANSYSTGTVAGSCSGCDNYSGGLVGHNWSSRGIINSYSTATVTGSSSISGSSSWNYSGGLVGKNEIGSIANSYSTGTVSGSSSSGSSYGWNLSGGLVGYNGGIIGNSYSTGAVTGSCSGATTNNYSGGLAGYNEYGIISNSFWNTDISSSCTGTGSCGTGAGKTTTQMKTLSTFTSAVWDIDDASGTGKVWRIYDGHTYPLLRSFLAPLTATANDAAKTYDGNPYSGGNGLSYASPVGVDATRVLGTPLYTGTSQGATAIGTYAITPGGLYSDQFGYDISYASGTLTINLAPVIASSIVIDPVTPTTLYAGLDGAGVYKSTDSGNTWNAANGTTPNNLTNLRVKALLRSTSGTLYAATYGGGVFRSTDSAATWTACGTSGLNLNVVSLTIDANGKLYAGTEAGVFMSTDGCATWTAMNNGLPN